MTVKLGINIDHIATIREARKIREPDPIAAAYIAEPPTSAKTSATSRTATSACSVAPSRQSSTWKWPPHRK